MKFLAKEIAALVGGKVEGNPDVAVSQLAKIEEGVEGSLAFLSNPAYASFIYTTKASVVIVNDDFSPEQTLSSSLTLIRVADARAAFAKILGAYNQYRLNKTGIEQQAFVSATAKMGKNVYIGAFAYIGENVVVGDNTKIYPHCYLGDNSKVGSDSIFYSGVKIYHDCIIGNDCILQGGVIIGGDGFGFQPNSENNYVKIPHIGNVILEDHVEIGANTTIDRATLGSTIIRRGVKLDNLIQVGHNCEIGENTVIASQTGISGSTKIGRDCMIGGQVGMVGHLTIGDRAKVAAQSGVGNNVADDEIVQGSPAFGIGDYKRSYVVFRSLPDLRSRVNDLEKKISK
ncbi:MAG: UDP-3-O-(3-hydroxymyristoyl)glucosamine N-acyltransferase [Bacteroidetes bacterium]|nr:UDP-3-O-(3-hydroxymyristoyl)glucosamine N-acyltransferase [Bacteroidota bacterium]